MTKQNLPQRREGRGRREGEEFSDRINRIYGMKRKEKGGKGFSHERTGKNRKKRKWLWTGFTG
jgi:hypothetical protein